MRPDEHKKKKNAEYKKKHGIQAKKESKKEEIKKDKLEKPQNSEEKQEKASKNAVCETRRFSRRKVTSNWDRYEDSEGGSDDAHQTIGRRGADFSTLLERAGDSHSQFRFQAEKEWEEESIGVQESQDVLKINFEDLSQSLNSLPLYKKLNIEENVIYSEHQEIDYDQRATIERMARDIDIRDRLAIMDFAEVNQKRSSNLSLNQQPKPQLNFNFLPSGADSPTTRNKKVTTNLSQSTKDLSSETSYGLNASTVTGTLHSMGVVKKTPQQDDDELDFLLSLENGQHQENSIKELDAKKAPNNIPLEIDFKMPDIQATEIDASKISLPLDKNTTSQDHSPSGKKSETPSDTQKPKEDLEDWLDSVLG